MFDDLAHRIVHSTTLSLRHASTLITKSSSPTDAALFLISHLLLLKQQIVAFDIEFVTPETDLQYDISSITNTFWELRSRGALFNPRNLVGLLIPKVVENMLDAKAEVDTVLRQAINDFTAQFMKRISEPILSKDSKTPLKVPVGEAAPRTTKIRGNIERETPFLRSKLEEYITDYRTREMLVAAVMESVTQTYEDWYDTAYTPSLNGTSRSTKGKGREDGVWDPDVFGEWSTGVFKVGTLGLGIMGADDGGFNVEDDGDDSDASMRAVSERTGTERTGGTGIRIRM